MDSSIPNVLTIAGSDPSGGAGIQADLKTFAALCVHGLSVVTALTVQNTQGVRAVYPVPAAVVAAQIDALYDDGEIHAVKIGMLADAEIVEVVAERLSRWHAAPVVIDPVMVSSSGRRLLSAEATEGLIRWLLPLAKVMTPNLDEAAVLIGQPVAPDASAMHAAMPALAKLGARAVLLKGGHGHGAESLDLFADEAGVLSLSAPRIATHNNHGTGCTLSAALAALLTRHEPRMAVRLAKTYLTQALKAADQLTVGQGHGPLHHFHAVWQSPTRSEAD